VTSPPGSPRDPSHDGRLAPVTPRELSPVMGPFLPGQDFLARVQELEAWHAARLRSGPRLVLQFSLLRRVLGRLGGPVVRVVPTQVPRPREGGVALTFVGHATTMLTTARSRVLTDPWLTDRLWGLRRLRAATLSPVDAADVSLILISHAHRDHLHLPSLAALPRQATVVVPPGCGGFVTPLGFPRVAELGPGRSYAQDDLEIVAVPVRHSSRRGFSRRAACGYVVRAHGRTVYFAGDTGYFSGFAEIGRRFAPEVALLPVGGYEPIALRREHMSPLDALVAFRDLGAKALVPLAWGSLPAAYELPQEPLFWLREEAERRGLGAALSLLGHGQTLQLA